MMAENSNRVLGASAAAKATGLRKAAAPLDGKPICTAPAGTSADETRDFGAHLQDAARSKNERAVARDDGSSRKANDSSRTTIRRNAEPPKSDASGKETVDSSAQCHESASAASDGASSQASTDTGDHAGNLSDAGAGSDDAQASTADAAAPDAGGLATQVLNLIGVAASSAAPAVCTPVASGTAALPCDASPDARLPTPQSVGADTAASSGMTAQTIAHYARELERMSAAPLPSMDDRVHGGTTDDSVTSAATPVSTSATANAPANPNLSASLQVLSDGLTAHRSVAELAPRSLEASVGSKAWREQLGTQLSWMIDRGEQLATLRLSPEHLGPLEVKIAVRESEATVWFGATQPETRAALEQAMPRLRDMLASQGIALTQSGVSSGSPQNQSRGAALTNRFSGTALAAEEPVAEVQRASNRGLVDLYA